MRFRCVLALAMLAIALSPAVTARNSAEFAPSADFTRLDAKGTVDITGSDAQEFRVAVDQYGNGDGHATEAETDKFLRDFRSMMEGFVSAGVADGNVTLDGKMPEGIDLASMGAKGSAGPVTSSDAITMEFHMVIRFMPAAGTTHTLFSRGSTDNEAGAAEITIRAPTGFHIQSATGIPGGASFNDARTTLTFTEVDGSSDSTIVFAQGAYSSGESKTSPALAAAVPVLLAAWLRARKGFAST